MKKNIEPAGWLLAILLCWNPSVSAEKIAGYLVKSDSRCQIWWIENTYKVMKDSPVPLQKGDPALWAARNETEAFQLVMSSRVNMAHVALEWGDFKQKNGAIVAKEHIQVRQVEYVHVTKPSGTEHPKGWFPDPLPRYDKPFEVRAGVNSTVWVSVTVPANTEPGQYRAHLKVTADGGFEQMIPIQLNVWNFTLPRVPYMRSAFGLYAGLLKDYHSIRKEDDLRKLTDLYFQSFKHYKISPQDFSDFYGIKKQVTGIDWQGGTYDPDTVVQGRYSMQVTDRSDRGNSEATFRDLIPIIPGRPYKLVWKSKTLGKNDQYSVVVRCYDADRKLIPWSQKGVVYKGSGQWQTDSLPIDSEKPFAIDNMVLYRPFPAETRFASVHLFATYPEQSGSGLGTVWFDDLRFIDHYNGTNLLPEGDFEQDYHKLGLQIDFSAFDKGAVRYLDEFGFTGFRVKVDELKAGPFVGKKVAWFNGFVYGTPEYKKLITLYLSQFQDHLEEKGWLGKEYLYWVDEPKKEDYEFVRQGMQIIHEAAPKLTRLITENHPGPEIMDVTEIGCPVLKQFDPEKSKDWIKKGRKMWSYLMTWPKAPHVNLFIDADAINMRMWLWMSYRYNLTGILVWCSNFWNTSSASPPGVLQDKWVDPMAYWGNREVPLGAASEFGNGDGVLFYPPRRDPNRDREPLISEPIPSLRLEILREGLDDYDYLKLLENCVLRAKPGQRQLVNRATRLLRLGSDVFVNDHEYTKDPQVLMRRRREIAELLCLFGKP